MKHLYVSLVAAILVIGNVAIADDCSAGNLTMQTPIAAFYSAAPSDPTYLHQQVDMLIALDQAEQAQSLLDQALKLDSRNARAWAKHGQVLRRMHKLDDALQSYTKAVELDPNYAWAWNGRGLTLAALGQQEDAIYCFRKATELDRTDVWYAYNLGDALVGPPGGRRG